MKPQRGDALLIVDLQHDFLPGGRLPVARGDEVIAPIVRSAARFAAAGLPIYASRDWHPADHCSFAAQGGPWPPHCIAESPGAQFAFAPPAGTTIVSKAQRPEADAYSAFAGTDLNARLRAAGVRRLWLCGLATDYCVLNTVRDARRLGYDVVLLADAVRAVDAQPGEGERALDEMRALGATLASSDSLE